MSTPERSLRERRASEAWLRDAGLPLVLPPHVRAKALLRRAAPMTWGLAFVFASLALASRAEARLPDTNDVEADDPAALDVLAALVILCAAPFVIWLVVVVMRRAPRPVTHVIAYAAASVALISPVLVGAGGWPPKWWERLAVLIALWLSIYWGAGSILTWMWRRGLLARGELGPMATRVLPLLVVATMFFFYNAEIWQVAVNMSPARSLAVAATMLLIALVLIAVSMRDELARLRGEMEDDSEREDHARLLGPTPFAPVDTSSAPPLRFSERANLLLTPVLAQLLQVIVFSLLVTVFFIAFGIIAIPAETANAWIGASAAPLPWPLSHLPTSLTGVKVALLLGGFAGLSFAASSASDATYRDAFVRPIVRELEIGVAARDAYVTTYPYRDSAGPHA